MEVRCRDHASGVADKKGSRYVMYIAGGAERKVIMDTNCAPSRGDTVLMAAKPFLRQ